MGKIIIFPRLTLFDEGFNLYDGIIELLERLNSQGCPIMIISHQKESLYKMKEILDSRVSFDLHYNYRRKVRDGFSDEHIKRTILVGSSDDDLILAVNKKILIINPGWSIKQEAKPLKYAYTIETPEKLSKAIELINNQEKWYFKLRVDESTQTYALTSANTYGTRVDATEREVLEGFSSLLKNGDRAYFKALYFHFISSIIKSPEFLEVDIWGVAPSSSGRINKEIWELKERCRYLMGKRLNEPLFIRHIPVTQSHRTAPGIRLQEGCSKHLNSVFINPSYKNKLKNKTVCILDDYITNGITFESLRNLLQKEKVKKIIFVGMGRYKKGSHGIYQKEDFELLGDVFSREYKYTKIKQNNLTGIYDDTAREEIKRLYEILNGH